LSTPTNVVILPLSAARDQLRPLASANGVQGLVLWLKLGLALGLTYFKDFGDNNVHHKQAYNIGDNFRVAADKYKTCRMVIRDSQATC